MAPLSLKQRLFVVTGMALLPAIAVVVTSVLILDAARQREVHAEARRAAELVALELERVVSGTENVLKTVAAAPIEVRADRAACAEFLTRTVRILPALSTIAVIQPDGQVWCQPNLPQSDLILGDRDFFQATATATTRVTGVYLEDPGTGHKVLPIAWPHRDATGALVAVVVGYIDLAWLQSLVEERTHVEGNSLTIADRDGRILARHPAPDRFVGTVIPQDFQRLVNAATAGTEALVSQDGTRRIVGYVPVSAPPEGIYVSTGIGAESAFSVVKTLATSGLLISIFGILLSFWLARYIARRFITRPFASLIRTVERWRNGDTQARTAMTREEGEIGRVGMELDAFMDELLQARSEQERLEAQRKLMSHELDHRVKNLLAMVQAVARQTLANSAAPEDMGKFNDRLKAIGTANALLMEERWQAARLRDVIETGIDPFRNKEVTNFRLQGPDLPCNSNACVAIGMALHELCTNAAKYGALSVPGGVVHLTWQVSDATFRLEWREEGGPTVQPPTRAGFGNTMIERVLGPQLGGKVDLSFEPGGVVCILECPQTGVVT